MLPLYAASRIEAWIGDYNLIIGACIVVTDGLFPLYHY